MLLEPWLVLLIGGLLLIGLYFFTWSLSVKLDNYSFVDVTWALSFAPISLWYALASQGWAPRRLAIGLLVALWGLRLGTYLWRRVASHHPKEDARYAVLRSKWKANPAKAFLWFFLAQAVLVWLLMLPVFLICQHDTSHFLPLEYAGLILWIISLAGEGLADAQLKQFKATNQDHNAVCQQGLWHYSRHPNYFFQSLLWWALLLMALPAPWGWTAIAAPLMMLHFLLNVTGIPLTEKLAVERKGKAYRDYQRTTSAFVPWFPKS
jgi:steroid 5-alpha reductase family enzyme